MINIIKYLIIILNLPLLVHACSAQSSDNFMLEKKDTNGKLYETELRNKETGELLNSVYTMLTGEKIPLQKKNCSSPKFIGGEEAFKKFLEDNLEWSSKFDGTGDIYLNLLLNDNGQVEEIRVVKGLDICSECTQLAINFVKKIPSWKPTLCNGTKSFSSFQLKVPFRPYPTKG